MIVLQVEAAKSLDALDGDDASDARWLSGDAGGTAENVKAAVYDGERREDVGETDDAATLASSAVPVVCAPVDSGRSRTFPKWIPRTGLKPVLRFVGSRG